jgi:hypothetical protein
MARAYHQQQALCCNTEPKDRPRLFQGWALEGLGHGWGSTLLAKCFRNTNARDDKSETWEGCVGTGVVAAIVALSFVLATFSHTLLLFSIAKAVLG